MIRAATIADAPPVAAIYNHYIRESVATFEEVPVADAEMARRIEATAARFPWLVAETAGRIAGYAYASAWKSRSAYRFAAECTIYVAPDRIRQGIGVRLYPALIAAMRERGLHCAIGGISLPNPASVALHEKLGFAPAGVLREVGRKFGQWVDVGYWELMLR